MVRNTRMNLALADDKPYEIRKTRIVAIDVLRGITIAFMILVNDPGDWDHVYAPLRHAEWNGWTPTDLVFPTFMFVMGCVMPFSLGRRIEKGEKSSALYADIFKRSLILFLIDILLNLFPHFDFHHLRVFGVLTRFSACYFLSSILFMKISNLNILCSLVGFLLFFYWILLAFFPIPGVGMPGRDFVRFDPHDNMVAWIDREFVDFCQNHFGFGALYRGYRDPEGILSTVPAVCTVIIGVISGIVLQKSFRNDDIHPLRKWMLAGLSLLLMSLVANIFFPINKNLWSSSFVMLCAGLDILVLYFLIKVIDVWNLYKTNSVINFLMKCAIIFGSNSIVSYCCSEFGDEILSEIPLLPGGEALKPFIYRHMFSFGNSTDFTSLVYGCSYVLLCFVPSYFLWKKKIIIKI